MISPNDCRFNFIPEGSPVDRRRRPARLEERVGLAERLRPEEAAVRRERRRVHRGHGRYAAEPGLEVLGVVAPEDRHQRAAAGGQRVDRAGGDVLPALALVRVGGARSHGEDPVEQHHALVAPRRQVAVRGRRHADVVLELLVDVDEARRERPDVGVHREAQADRVPGVRVRVLADDEDPDVGQRSLEGAEDVVARRLVAAPAASSARRNRPISVIRSSTGASAVGPVGGDRGPSRASPGELAVTPPRNALLGRNGRRPFSPTSTARIAWWVASPWIADWLATRIFVPRNVALHGVSNGIGDPLSPVSGTSGKRATSAPVGVDLDDLVGQAGQRDVDVPGPAADPEAVGQVGGLGGPQRLDGAGPAAGA